MFRLIALLLLAQFNWVHADAGDPAEPDGAAFARIGEQTITQAEFKQVLQQRARGRFYHGEVPADALLSFAEETARWLIDRRLLDREAEVRGIEADPAYVNDETAKFVAKNAGAEIFETHMDEILEEVRVQLEAASRIDKLESSIRESVQLSESEIVGYYQSNPDKFTEPDRKRIGLILIGVDPSAGSEAWEAAKLLAEQLRFRIDNGEAFDALAREYSTDVSADQGGDMGYLHAGMLGDIAQGVVDDLSVGELSQPVVLLEGIAIIKLIDSSLGALNPLEAVRDRAAALALREKRDRVWQEFADSLWSKYDADIDEAAYSQMGLAKAGGEVSVPAVDSGR